MPKQSVHEKLLDDKKDDEKRRASTIYLKREIL